jgi:hypothetical protein
MTRHGGVHIGAGVGTIIARSCRMMHKVSLLPAMLLILAAAVAAKVRAMIAAQVPEGYQDEAGFHTGVKPARDPGWPSLW